MVHYQKSHHFFLYLSLVIASVSVFGASTAFASPRFTLGQTLDPDCGPSDADCTVATNIFSSTATSSFANSINLLSGCYAVKG